jgi:phosphatidylserine/phosphatidylglycerophosphate/cardiolipin synthase-like enzyme
MSLSFSHLVVEPDDVVPPVLDFISSAEKTLLIKQFTFSEPSLVQAVAERKNAGVEVRVMLNPKRSGGDRANDETYDYFKKNGVNIRWANPKFYVTHEKSIVVDGKRAHCTFNLCVSPTQEHDYEMLTTRPGSGGADH